MPSSAIRDFEYDASSEQLLITFVTGRTYVYDRVPEHVHDEFIAAPSKGAFFNRFIRDQYSYREVSRVAD